MTGPSSTGDTPKLDPTSNFVPTVPPVNIIPGNPVTLTVYTK
jgi:hypothetical protein